MYRQLVASQWIFMGTAGALAAVAVFGPADWYAEYLGRDTVASLGVCFVLGAISYYGSIVVHELAELNDQLAGRSTEFRDFLSELSVQRGD